MAFLQKLMNDRKHYDKYLAKFGEDPRNYPNILDKFIKLATLSDSIGMLNKYESNLINNPNFKRFSLESKTLYETAVKCSIENPNIVGFEFVKDFKNFLDPTNYHVWVMGGAAGYLHVLNMESYEIQLKDIDFNVISNENGDDEDIYNKLVYFANEFCKIKGLRYEMVEIPDKFSVPGHPQKFSIGYIVLYRGDEKFVELNYFINQFRQSELPIIESLHGIPVITLESCYNQEVSQLNDYKMQVEEWDNGNHDMTDEDEIEMFREKIPRKIELVEHLGKFAETY